MATNLQTKVSAPLWAAVESAYDAGNFSHAVLEAMHVVTGVLRDKAGIDGDGAPLVGQALGGDAPKIRLNTLETDTDRNVQRGVEQILRGMYGAIRNPRSHNANSDDQKTADAIIQFIDYLLGLLDSSTESFTVDGFWARITDADFVDSERYSELLLSEVPPMRRGDMLMHIFQHRRELQLSTRRTLIRLLVLQLNDAQTANYLAAVSAELRTVTDEASIRTALQMVRPDQWTRISEAARIRIEQKLLKALAEGEILQAGQGKVTSPLATWSRAFLQYFSARAEAVQILLTKLEDTDRDDRAYVARFFLWQLPSIVITDGDRDRAIAAVAHAVRENDQEVRGKLIEAIASFPPPWQEQLVQALRDLADDANPAVQLPSGPFLSAPTVEDFDDDIPF